MTTISELRDAVRLLLDVMDMQEKRESGEFHIPADSAKSVWDKAKQKAVDALSADPAKASGSAPDVETIARKLFEAEPLALQRNHRGEWAWDKLSATERQAWLSFAQAAIEILQPATRRPARRR